MAAFYEDTKLALFYERLNLEATDSPMVPEGLECATTNDLGEFSFFQNLGPHGIEPAFREISATAANLLLEGCALWGEDKDPTAITALDKILEEFDCCDLPDFQEILVLTLFHIARMGMELGEDETALAACKELLARFDVYCSSGRRLSTLGG